MLRPEGSSRAEVIHQRFADAIISQVQTVIPVPVSVPCSHDEKQ